MLIHRFTADKSEGGVFLHNGNTRNPFLLCKKLTMINTRGDYKVTKFLVILDLYVSGTAEKMRSIRW